MTGDIEPDFQIYSTVKKDLPLLSSQYPSANTRILFNIPLAKQSSGLIAR